MSKIYLIYGVTGSYDSYTTWNVRAYRDIHKATLDVAFMNTWCFKNKDTDEYPDFDKNYQVDSLTGVHYEVEEVELI